MGSDGGFAPRFLLVGAAAEGGVYRCTSLGRFTMRWLVQAETAVRLQLSRNGLGLTNPINSRMAGNPEVGKGSFVNFWVTGFEEINL
jgi:hypothetical protein